MRGSLVGGHDLQDGFGQDERPQLKGPDSDGQRRPEEIHRNPVVNRDPPPPGSTGGRASKTVKGSTPGASTCTGTLQQKTLVLSAARGHQAKAGRKATPRPLGSSLVHDEALDEELSIGALLRHLVLVLRVDELPEVVPGLHLLCQVLHQRQRKARQAAALEKQEPWGRTRGSKGV